MRKSSKCLFYSLFAAAAPVLLFTGCVEQSVVIKVKKDGSGIVHERNYTNDAMGEMFAGGFEIGEEEADIEVESSSDLPSEADLKEIASRMGEGVTFKTLQEGKNRSGWAGYEVIYEFTDINKLRIDMNDFNPQEGEEDVEQPTTDEEPEIVTFEMAGKTLKIITPDPATGLGGGEQPGGGESGIPGGADDPFAALDPADPQSAMAFTMMAGMTTGMRMGLFVMADDPIASTNAKHQNGNMITLMMMEMGKIFQNQANMAKMQSMQTEKDRDKLQEVADSIDGVTVDLQSPIIIEFE